MPPPTAMSICWLWARAANKQTVHTEAMGANLLKYSPLYRCVQDLKKYSPDPAESGEFAAESTTQSGPMVYPIEAPTRNTLSLLKTSVLLTM